MRHKLMWTARALTVVGVIYLYVNPAPLYALFGFGDIVFDPSAYATLGEIWTEDISTGLKMAKTLEQTIVIAQNAVQTYQLALQMSQRITNKQAWQVAAFGMGNEALQRNYNIGINFASAMNGDFLNAAQAYQQSTLDSGDGSYLGNVTPTQSRRMAEFATVQLLDQTSQRCAAILANYRATQDVNQPGEDALQAVVMDEGDSTNAQVAVLNTISAGQIQVRTQEKNNGNLLACQAEENMLHAKLERDRLSAEQGFYADVANERAAANTLLDPDGTAMQSSGYMVP